MCSKEAKITMQMRDANFIVKILIKPIDMVGAKNVVQVKENNVKSCKAADKFIGQSNIKAHLLDSMYAHFCHAEDWHTNLVDQRSFCQGWGDSKLWQVIISHKLFSDP